MLTNNLQIDQELWSIYAWWTSILVLKMMYLTWATGRLRVEHKVFHSEEDKMWAEGPVTLCCSGGGHPAVDRIRAVHQRDLKILIPYIIFAPLWLIISPCNFITQLLLRIVPLSNILYTFIYLNTTQIFGSNCCKILSYLEHFTVLTAIVLYFLRLLKIQ